jgi:AraC family transcriptional regulator of adaptative response/methylated-DNA-[protein]-cysteine methyltransferase
LRLHDTFIKTVGMMPDECKNGGENLIINYSFAPSPFGDILVAATQKGICYIAFSDNENLALSTMKSQFPKALFDAKSDAIQQNALCFVSEDWSQLKQIHLHLKATPFQLKVWQELLNIPFGTLSTYGAIAKKIAHPKAARAVGTAIGSNPVAFLIPCHRVIQASGAFGNYMWGSTRKTEMIVWEQTASHQYQSA